MLRTVAVMLTLGRRLHADLFPARSKGIAPVDRHAALRARLFLHRSRHNTDPAEEQDQDDDDVEGGHTDE